MKSRIEQLRAQFPGPGLDAFLVTSAPHLRYLCRFSGTAGIGLVTRSAVALITDGRYATQAGQQARGWRVFVSEDSLFDEMRRRNLLRKGWRIAVDGASLPYTTFLTLRSKFPGVTFVARGGMVEKIAAVKDATEIRKIRHAAAITDTVFHEILSVIRPGIRELDIAAEISYRQRKHGAEADAFESIVASGARGSLPHARATPKKIRRGELLTLDFGCVFEGYSSDLTRTVAVGRPTSEKRDIYQTVLDAQTRALEHARSGVLARDLDAVARGAIKKKGYGRYFPHSLGHGLGLQVHEPPRISSRSLARLQAGNVITVEPGIYIPARCGVRIEDDVLIKNGHCEVLTHSPKNLLVL